jgi:hypothetical protein
LETVTVWPALRVPTVVPAKVIIGGLRLNAAGLRPVPETPTCTAGTPRLVDATVMVPFRLPAVKGAKITGAMHIRPAARLVPQLPEPTLKGPDVANERPSRTPVPGLLTVNCKPALFEPAATEPKASSDGVTANCAVGSPVPVNPTTTGVNPDVVDRIVTDPIRVPG